MRIKIQVNIGGIDARKLELPDDLQLTSEGSVIEANESAAKEMIARGWAIPVPEAPKALPARAGTKPAKE